MPAALILATLFAPQAAAAQSYDPTVWYESGYAIDSSDGFLIFGNGTVGQSVPTSGTASGTYSSGSGATGNTAGWWSEVFGCWILGC